MTSDSLSKARAFKEEVEGKIQKTVQEFAEGKLSREQFQLIYARYTDQLTIATMALMSGETGKIDDVKSDGSSTIAIKSSAQGKAVGLMIYYNKTGTILETLGDVSVPIGVIGPILNDFSMLMEDNQKVERQVKKIQDREWLLLSAGKYTTIVTQFRNEPALIQIQYLEKLHSDFEKANRALFETDRVSAESLAYPFMVFIEKKRIQRGS